MFKCPNDFSKLTQLINSTDLVIYKAQTELNILTEKR